MGVLKSPRIHHVTLVASDSDGAASFYGDVLGLHQLPERTGEDGALFVGDREGRPGSLLRIIEQEGAGKGNPGIGGIHHVAFGTADEGSLLRWKRWLTDRGIRVTGPYDRGYFTSLYFTDPDGQILEIATRGPGYGIDEPAEELGREMKVPPRQIVRGHRDEAAIAALTHPEPVEGITEEMVLEGIHHVSGITDDLRLAGKMLECGLGLSLVKKTTNRDDPSQLHYFWANSEGGRIGPHSAYTLFGWPSGWKKSRAGVGQVESVSFQAEKADDFEAWIEQLRGLGLPVAQLDDRLPERGFRFWGTDGMEMQIVPGHRAETRHGSPGVAESVEGSEGGRAVLSST